MKFLSRAIDGCINLLSAINTTTGVGDAGQIIETDANGLLDPSFFPPGSTLTTESAQATEALNAGNFVNVYSDGGTDSVRKAIANNVDKLANGFVLDNYAISDTVTVFTVGVNTSITAVPGEVYYLSQTTPGGATTTAPTETSTHFQQVLGIGVPSGINYEFEDIICFP